MIIDDMLFTLRDADGSDLHVQSGQVPKIRVEGKLRNLNMLPLNKAQLDNIVESMDPGSRVIGRYIDNMGADFRYNHPTLGSYRVNMIQCEGGRKLTMRSLNRKIPPIERLGFEPHIFERIHKMKKGMVIITGPTNSGKSTTLASAINMFKEDRLNIITLEDPIEYLIEDRYSMITQRELDKDFLNFPGAIKHAMRQDPDMLIISEMRDVDTIRAGILCAETGHLVLTTLHTNDIPSTLNRMLITFDHTERSEIKAMLNDVIRCIIAQRLVFDEGTQKLKLVYDYKFFDIEDAFGE